MNQASIALLVCSILIPFPLLAEPATEFDRLIKPILLEYCGTCHSSTEREGGLSLDEIDFAIDDGRGLELWRMIYERIRFGEMPPKEAEQPTPAQRTKLLAWMRAELLKTQQPDYPTKLRLPQFGNYIDHIALFDEQAGPVVPNPPRLWRLRPQIYQAAIVGETESIGLEDLSGPLNIGKERGLKDYASRYFVDEPTAGALLANAEMIVKLKSRSDLDALSTTDAKPSKEIVRRAIRRTFLTVLRRKPTVTELQRFEQFHHSILETSGKRLAAQQLLIAIYMQPQVLFREELGEGPPDQYGRIRLSQRELALAISYALGNRPDQLLLTAAQQCKLSTREQIVSHVQRRLDLLPIEDRNPRILQFFREYFGYSNASRVFKNQPKRGSHLPQMLVTDLELLIEHIVVRDKEVLFELLTTNEYFVDCRRDRVTGRLCQSSLDAASPEDSATSNPEHATIYGLPRDWIWTERQPVAVPAHMRAGVLTHPAWLVAWSGNFDNHPVQRGKWIRTHLLGGTVPDVPIGVEATVLADKTKQFRERLTTATSHARCQRCHRKMDPLGLPFEQYDHYGRFRIRELGRLVNTSGAITLVDDKTVAGTISNPIEMMHRLAKSAHVEQVFVRYVFRYFMGRNETLGDAKTLQEAHQVYRESGGSFRELVISLLASDSFLYRTIGGSDD